MCLNLIGSQYTGIDEVEYLLDNDRTEEKILAIKDSRELIEMELRLIEAEEYLEMVGI